jgi:hypothetical protein
MVEGKLSYLNYTMKTRMNINSSERIKLSLSMVKIHRGSGAIVPLILNLGTTGR